ncbi:MAG: DUF222 domain-containing protein [Acidimicrobiales bacterium]
MKIDDLKGFVDELFEEGPVSDPESVETLMREFTRMEAYVTASVGEFDTWGAWAGDGARGAAGWIATRGRIPVAAVQRQVRRARHLRQLKDCDRAWRAGDIDAAHVDAICKKHRGPTAPALERDEEMLVDQARTLRFSDFTRALAYWSQQADPDGAEWDAEAHRARRDVYLVPSLDGMYFGQMTLDRVS